MLGEPSGERVAERLRDVGLDKAARQFPHELSGGMKKRASLARATITRPPICFYDEPTAGLDPVTAAKIYALIQRFAREDGAAALIISNELDTLLPVCDRVLMLHDGAMIFSGTTAELHAATHPAVRQFVSGANEGPL
jgi:phospholipid/cholesterol/gamma-HCH transport system ATP-binding protein